MAFTGTFISQIKIVIHEKTNLTTSAQQSAKLFNDDRSSSSSESSDSRPLNGNSNEYAEANYPGVFDSELTSLTTAQRNIFIVILTVLFMLSLCGNVCTLFVNFRRKIRPFFRACLISLAFSDLMNTVFLTASYLSQFTADFVQIWSLGNVMCSWVPFATTCAILASSMSLVGIALDRYFAVMKAVIGFWNPSVISCIACMLCIWLASISIACPVFTFYDLIPVYILKEIHETENATEWSTTIKATTEVPVMNGSVLMVPKKPSIKVTLNLMTTPAITMRNTLAAKIATGTKTPWEMGASRENLSYTLVSKQKLVNMCVSDQDNVSVYYVIVFAIIFVPCIVAFFWFNTVIARKLWNRRHLAAITKQRNLKTKDENNLATDCSPSKAKSSQTEQLKSVALQNKNCNCKSIQTSSTTTAYSNVSNTMCSKVKKSAALSTNHSREARHLKMFTIILIMMAVFLFLRLPAWIFLLMRMFGHYKQPQCWIFYFIFGLMNLTSSVLNPLFYTFLPETLKYVLKLKTKVSSLHCGRFLQNCCCCCCGKNNSLFCRCSTFPRWPTFGSMPDLKYNVQTHSLQPESEETSSKHCMPASSNEKDEGVDCNDENVEEEEECVCHFHEYNQRIYTIFPPALVSSSVNSEY